MDNRTLYEKNVQDRSRFRYLIGLIIRWKQNLKYAKARRIARKRGAKIGIGVIMPIEFAKRLNNNVTIGNHVSIQTSNITAIRYPIKIGDNVIIGSNVRIVMGSHNIDSAEWERIRPNSGLIIEDYVWCCPDSVILPSCTNIGYGAVIVANAVVVKDVPRMSIMSGNPAKFIRERKQIHSKLVIESLLGGDYTIYKETRKNGKRKN